MKKPRTEKELFLQKSKQIYTIEKKIETKELSLNDIDELIPGYLHFNKLSDLSMQYMSKNGCSMFEISNKDLATDFLKLTDVFVNMDFAMKNTLQSILKFRQLNDNNATFSFFEQIRYSHKKDFDLYCTDIKILKESDYMVCMTNPIKSLGITEKKLQSILHENEFFDKNFQRFMSLTKREKEILRHIALGHSNKEMCELLFVSSDTIKTHRRHINKKLEAKHISDLIKHAQVFRLI